MPDKEACVPTDEECIAAYIHAVDTAWMLTPVKKRKGFRSTPLDSLLVNLALERPDMENVDIEHDGSAFRGSMLIATRWAKLNPESEPARQIKLLGLRAPMRHHLMFANSRKMW